ncbi:MAG: alpha/beta fold hydrolase [Verrucomicrobiota bacterium]
MTRYTDAALVADALSLGSHWIYNQQKLARLYPNGVEDLRDPASNYHPNRVAGQFTHYGDQALYLAESLSEGSRYEHEEWKRTWLERMEGYDGYLDGASKTTLESNGETASTSNDLAGASRLAPILDLDLPLAEAVAAARDQTALTHNDGEVIDAAEFFVRAVKAIESGSSIEQAFELAAEADYESLDPKSTLERVRAADPEDFLTVSQDFGLTCHAPEAFPIVLYLAQQQGADFLSAISRNALAGGDTSARAMLLALVFAARDGDVGAPWKDRLLVKGPQKREALAPGSHPITIPGPMGLLSGVIEIPQDKPVAFALFAHCFTCGKDYVPEARVTRLLAERGIATLRIDFAGIGKSDGEFADSSFVTNLEDIYAAATWLRENHAAPHLLVGHSLGGAAVLAAAGQIPEVRAVVTIGAPFQPEHVTHLFQDHLETIETAGVAEVPLAGRVFSVGKRFLDDLAEHNQVARLSDLRGVDTLILHSPEDQVVPLKNAGDIYSALNHPKSFVSLAGADHLLTKKRDAEYVANLIATWASRSIEIS